MDGKTLCLPSLPGNHETNTICCGILIFFALVQHLGSKRRNYFGMDLGRGDKKWRCAELYSMTPELLHM